MSRIDIYILIFICFSMLLAFVSCNDTSKQSVPQQALTEYDFSDDPELKAYPRGGVITTFLEHPDTSSELKDTGVVGRDIIPLTYSTNTSHTYCWEDEDMDSRHFMTLNDINGIEIIRVIANGDCVTEVIGPGDYYMYLHHDGRIDRSFSIFLYRQDDQLRVLKTVSYD